MIALEMAVIILAMTACHTIRQEVGSLGNYVQDDVTMQQELSGPTRQNDCLSGSASFYTESEAVNFSLSVTAKNTVSVTLSETAAKLNILQETKKLLLCQPSDWKQTKKQPFFLI